LFSSNLNHSGYSGDKEYQFGTDNIFHAEETESENKTLHMNLVSYGTHFTLEPMSQIRIRNRMFLGHLDSLFGGTDPDPAPDPFIIKKKNPDPYCFVTSLCFLS
jgi:hypothetical protein